MTDYLTKPCPICGETSYVWGFLGAERIRFYPSDAGFFERTLGMGKRVAARRCDVCQNIQLFDNDSEV